MVNKKEAISYAQITLNFMQSSKYNNELNAENFGIEMKHAFKLYPRNIVFNIANAQIKSSQKLKSIKEGEKINEQ